MAFWEDVEDAVQRAIARTSALPPDHVVWAHQDAPAPARPYVSMSLAGLEPRGQDYLRESTDLSRPNGQEVRIEARGVRETSLELSCFTDDTGGEGAARAVLERAKTGLVLPTPRSILAAVGVSPFDPGRVNWVPEVVAANFRGRATCSVRCYMPAEAVAEYFGYIARVSGAATVHGGAADPLTKPFSAP